MPRPRRVDPPLSPVLPPLSQLPAYAARQELKIVLPDIYRPGITAASRSQPISLVPPRDDPRTAAYIVDKLVTPIDGWGDVPATADDYDTDEEDERYRQSPARQQVQRTLCYVVGWPDEPYAQLLVPCTAILEYVSPRTVEDWEYARAEALRAAAKQRAAVKAEATERKAPEAPRRGPGRPAQTAAATAARVAKAAARAAARAAAQAAQGVAIPTTPVKVPSLTDVRTPRPASSLSGRPSLSSSLSGLQIQLDLPKMPMATQVSVSLGGPPPLAALLSSPVSEKQHAGPSLKRPFQQFVEAADDHGFGPVMETTTTTTNTSANEEEGEDDEEVADSEEDEENEEDELTLSSVQGMRPPSINGPPPLQAEPPPKLQKTAGDRPHPTSYIPPPTVPLSRPQTTIAIPTTTDASLKRKRSESKETPVHPPIPQPHSPAADEEQEEDLYEVDRLVGDCLAPVDEDGNGDMEGLPADGVPETVAGPGSRLVRYFLVRWKGDWPPDQNPTWEPVENLPPRMVRQYLKKAAQKEASRHERSSQ